jgi:hypothetical protein
MIAMISEAVHISETSVSIYQTTVRNTRKDTRLHTRHRDNLKSHEDTLTKILDLLLYSFWYFPANMGIASVLSICFT